MNMKTYISIADDEAISYLGSNFSDDNQSLSSVKSNDNDSSIMTIEKFSSIEILKYKSLDKFFRKLDDKDVKLMVDIINKQSDISLRILDKYVTKYCPKMNVTYKINDTDEDEFNVHISYKAQLKSYRKGFFDPFRRGKKFYYNYDKSDNSKVTLTTLGQLNFFRWGFSNKLFEHILKNKDEITSVISKWDKESFDKKKKVKKQSVYVKKKKYPVKPVDSFSKSPLIVNFD